jgi:hypothetical protein
MSRHYKRGMPRSKTTKNPREGLPNLALEKCVKTYSLKVQPSLYRILRQCTPEKIRQILIEKLAKEKKALA